MKISTIAVGVFAAACLVAGAAQAAVVSVSSSTLASSVGAYSNLDAAGTDLSVTASGGGSLATIGGGSFEGLWFGNFSQSGDYTLTFSAPIDYFSIHVNAMSTFGSHVETIGQFTTNAAGPLNFAFTNIQMSAWDGSTITSGPQDNGEFNMVITAGGASFTTVSFHHFQSGAPNGSVIRDIGYQLAAGRGVPEPATWALMIGGFALSGAALRRRRAAPAN